MFYSILYNLYRYEDKSELNYEQSEKEFRWRCMPSKKRKSQIYHPILIEPHWPSLEVAILIQYIMAPLKCHHVNPVLLASNSQKSPSLLGPSGSNGSGSKLIMLSKKISKFGFFFRSLDFELENSQLACELVHLMFFQITMKIKIIN